MGGSLNHQPDNYKESLKTQSGCPNGSLFYQLHRRLAAAAETVFVGSLQSLVIACTWGMKTTLHLFSVI